MKPDADSDNDVPTVEPPLQHKKRVYGPPTSLSTEYFSLPPDAPEYTLLGQQEKFAINVKYHGKKTAPVGLYKNKENFDSPPPPSKQLKMQKRIKPQIKERHPPVTRPSHGLADTKSPLSPPPAPREHRDYIAIKEAMKDKDLRDVLGERPAVTKSEEQISRITQNAKLKAPVATRNELVQTDKKKSMATSAVQETVTDKNVRNVSGDRLDFVRSEQQPQTTQIRKKKDDIFTMNEFVQTDMKKGVAISAPEAPADYALKYKARVARPRLTKQVSEYQKQFQWKDNMKTSPLLGAEEIVFKSKADLGPYKSDGMARKSEYKHQFHPWKPEAFQSDINLNVSNNNDNNNNINSNNNTRDSKAERKRKSKVKRSRSTGAVPDHDESVEVVKDQQAAESASNELKAKLKKAYGKSRRITTEYRANYRSPTSFRYENGVWKGAYPPQLVRDITNGEVTSNINANNNNNNNNADSSVSTSWFAEVIELRRRAEEYRKRAQGTHFSREHLVQLLAKQNECWDLDAEASSTIKALNLEKPVIRAGDSKKLADTGGLRHQVGSREGSPGVSDVDEIVLEQKTPDEGEKPGKLKNGGRSSQNRKSRKMAWLEEQKEKIAQQRRRLEKEKVGPEHDYDDDEAATEKFEGRLPTPVLQKSVSPPRRHHLDLTTPSVGGAILTCPPTRENKMIVTSRTGHSYVTASDDYPVRSLQKTYNVDNLRTMPIYGRPSDDTHYLRNDSADSDKPLKTQYVASPSLYDSDDDKENQESQHVQKQSKRSNRNQRPGDLSTVPEGYGRTYNLSEPFLNLDDIKNSSNRKDDDVMSVSLMSVASSHSLASDVLERTKKRQDYWNKKT